MAEVLSQNEIDALLEALSSGTLQVDEVINEEKKKKVKPYDFRRPNKLSKDQLRTMVMLHENFSRLLTTSLSTYLRSMVRAQVISVDQLTYEEFTKSLHNPTVMNILTLKPLEGNIILEISPQLAFAVVDRLLGGQGLIMDKVRELTDIEQTVIRRVVLKTFTNLKEAWKAVVDLEPVFEGIESNPMFTQIVPPADMIILVTLELRIAEAIGMMNICMPFSVIEPILDRLNAQVWFTKKGKSFSAQGISALQNRLGQAQVQVTVELGKAEIRVGELLNIAVGDVIELDKSVKELMEIKIGNQVKFRGSPGMSGSKMAVQIGQIVREEGS